MQHPSPAISSPSTGFLGPRASPLFSSSSLDQPVDGGGGGINSSDLLRAPPSMAPGRVAHDQQHPEQQEAAAAAPPKRLSKALESLGNAHRHIADVRSGADLVLEALVSAVGLRRREFSGAADKKGSDGIVHAAESVKSATEALRSVGRELESSGILKAAQNRYEDHQPWGLQPPTVCPDGEVTPYAWKRQIAGQAAASAVERTRLALKSFGEQRRRFFPASEDGRQWSKRARAESEEATLEEPSLGNVLKAIQIAAPRMAVTPYVRLEWGRRTILSNLSKTVPDSVQALALLPPQSLNPVRVEPGQFPAVSAATSPPKLDGKVGVLEVTMPGVLRAVISLNPVGSAHPDAVAVFSPDEFGSNVHAWGVSRFKLHQRISEHGVNALHYFRRFFHKTALERLLHWLNTYQTLFTEPCNVCKRMTALDFPSDLLFPPLVRLYHHLQLPQGSTVAVMSEERKEGELAPFHVGCIPKEELEST